MQDGVVMEPSQVIRRREVSHHTGEFMIGGFMHTIEPAYKERHRPAAMRQDKLQLREPVEHPGGYQRAYRQGGVVGIGNYLVERIAFGARRGNGLDRMNKYRRAQRDACRPEFIELTIAEIVAIYVRRHHGPDGAFRHGPFQFTGGQGGILQRSRSHP